MRAVPPFLCAVALLAGFGASAAGAHAQGRQASLPPCEWCGADEAPADLDWQATIAGPEEPGEPLVISGTVYEADGETPAEGVLLYVHHTNSEGLYPRRGDEVGNARRHGYLRAWMRTDERGRYRFTTIRPGTYPTRAAPAHIHVTVTPPGEEEYWIDSFVFEGDPLLSEEDERGSGVVPLVRDDRGTWLGTRDIVLRR